MIMPASAKTMTIGVIILAAPGCVSTFVSSGVMVFVGAISWVDVGSTGVCVADGVTLGGTGIGVAVAGGVTRRSSFCPG